MPLTPYESQYKAVTPPAAEHIPGLSPARYARHPSHSPGRSVGGQSSSSVEDFNVPTPPRHNSPVTRFCYGQRLLPKVQTQDLGVPHRRALPRCHRRAVSHETPTPATSVTIVPNQYVRRATTPPDSVGNFLTTPVSAYSQISFGDSSFGLNSAAQTPISATYNPFANAGHGHYRSSSTSSTDSNITLLRYLGHAQLQQYSHPAQWNTTITPTNSVPQETFMPPLMPEPVPEPVPYACDPELEPQPGDTMCSMIDYLTSRNPAVDLVRQASPGHPGKVKHYWWDIKRVGSWDSFTLETINSHPDPSWLRLLNDPNYPSRAFPQPTVSRSRLHPECRSDLIGVIRDYYMEKVNVALQRFSGKGNCLSMCLHDGLGPSFVSRKEEDHRNPRMTRAQNDQNGELVEPARIVGIALVYESWNSNMRHGNAIKKVDYLRGLAELQFYMLRHGTRYGFILTERELVCARWSALATPRFGAVELSDPIPVERWGEGKLTVPLALWYLHMLASDSHAPGQSPVPGEVHWRAHLPIKARMNCVGKDDARDEWIPNPSFHEQRNAARTRGWKQPWDNWNKRMEGKAR